MRSRQFRPFIATLAALVITVVTACGQSDSSDPRDGEAGVIRLGALLPISGGSAPSGAKMIPAFELAVREANEAGGVLGRRVEVVTSDDACDPQTAVAEANAILASDITVSIGGYCSSATVPTLKIFRSAGIPMIIPAANSTELLVPGYDSIFLLAGTTEIEAERAVEWMPKLGVHRAIMVHDGTSFSETVAKAAATAAGRSGSGVTLVDEMQLSQGASHYSRIADQILAADSDVVFFTGYYAEAGKLIRDLRGAGYAGKIMLSDGGVDPALFREVSPSLAEGVYGLALPMPQFQPGAEEWSAKYRELAGYEAGPFTMQAYDAARLALDAIRRAGTVDRPAVRKALAETTPDDIQLLSGTASFNSDGTQQDARFILLRVQDGAFVLDPLNSR